MGDVEILESEALAELGDDFLSTQTPNEPQSLISPEMDSSAVGAEETRVRVSVSVSGKEGLKGEMAAGCDLGDGFPGDGEVTVHLPSTGNGSHDVVKNTSNVGSGLEFEVGFGKGADCISDMLIGDGPDGEMEVDGVSRVVESADVSPKRLGNEDVKGVVDSGLKFEVGSGNGADCISDMLIGDGPAGKMEVDGVSLVVDVEGSLESVDLSGKQCGNEDAKCVVDPDLKFEVGFGNGADCTSDMLVGDGPEEKVVVDANDVSLIVDDVNGSLESAGVSGKMCGDEDVNGVVDSGLKFEVNLGNCEVDADGDSLIVDADGSLESVDGSGKICGDDDVKGYVDCGLKNEVNLENGADCSSAMLIGQAPDGKVEVDAEDAPLIVDVTSLESADVSGNEDVKGFVDSGLQIEVDLGNGADCNSAMLIGDGPDGKVEVDGYLGSADVSEKICGNDDVKGYVAENVGDSGPEMEENWVFGAKNGKEERAVGDKEELDGENDTREEIDGEIKDFNEGNGGDVILGDGNVNVPDGVKDASNVDSGLKNEVNSGNGADCDSAMLIGDGPDGNVEVDANDFSLIVEVNGSLESADASEKKCGNGNGGDDSGQEMQENAGSEAENGREERAVGDKEGLHGKNDTREEETNGGTKDFNEGNGGGDDENDDDDNMGDQDHKYLVGDFVWGKIRSHPWWPGQIYDPSDASEFAVKCRQRNRLLVAYFGDSSFAWCLPSQLKPFSENFNEMSAQSSSKSFVNAVEKALDEYGRSLEAKLTCSCTQKVNQHGPNSKPLALNAGIKQEIHVPKGSFSKLAFTEHEPTEFVAQLREIARVNSITSSLELKVMKSWLSVFYGAKGGGFQLASYHDPLPVEGLEDKNIKGVKNSNRPKEIPEEFPSLLKCPGISEENLSQKRKYRSIDALLHEEASLDEDETQRENVLSSPSSVKKRRGRKKKAEIVGSPKSTENNIKNDDDDDDEDYDEEIVKESRIAYPASGSRERKKSKYLSPPYTCLERKLSYKIEESESAELVKIVGEKTQEKLSAGSEKENKNIITCEEVDVSTDKVLNEVHTAALNPSKLRKKALDRIMGFVCNFRSSIFIDGSNYKRYHNRGKKRKSAMSSESPGKEGAPSNSEVSEIRFVKQKLEEMTSIVKKAAKEGGKLTVEMKAELEGDIKGLLEKIGTMD